MPYDLLHIFIALFAKRMASIKSLEKKVDELDKRIKALEAENGGGD